MNYRREIDGLRAVAVVPVIAFHAGLGPFSGGYVGVDIFFVISGYLITSILIGDIREGRFSILGFYERRARRILPALLLVLAACLPFAWAWMLPQEFADFARSMAATALFLSNAHFWEGAGYFQAQTELMPLLHTWSLAIEEQYYLLFPLILLAMRRWRLRRVFAVLLVLFALSLGLSEWGWRNYPDENFFFTFSRFWELLVGSICAFLQRHDGQARNGPLALSGLAMILVAIFWYDASVPFPSLYTLLPVVGAALIILYGPQGTLAARVLSNPVFVGIGLISYSAYLWHQPLLAFARIRSIEHPSPVLMAALVPVAFALAWLSWRFVEQPFRRKSFRLSARRGPLFAFAILGSGAFVAVGLNIERAGGYPSRMPAEVQAQLARGAERNPLIDQCFFGTGDAIPVHPIEPCLAFARERRIDVMFIGDSHSDAISYPAQAALSEAGLTSYAVHYAGCVSLPGFYRVDQPARHDCDGYNRGMLDYARAAGIETLVLTSRYTWYWIGDPFDNGEGGAEMVAPGYVDLDTTRAVPSAYNDPARRDRVLAGYRARLEELAAEFRLVVVYPIPEAGWHVPQVLARRTLFGEDAGAPISTSHALYRARNGPVLDLFDRLAEEGRIIPVRPEAVFCDTVLPGRCVNSLDDALFYYDTNHPSSHGARLLAPFIRDAVAAAQEG